MICELLFQRKGQLKFCSILSLKTLIVGFGFFLFGIRLFYFSMYLLQTHFLFFLINQRYSIGHKWHPNTESFAEPRCASTGVVYGRGSAGNKAATHRDRTRTAGHLAESSRRGGACAQKLYGICRAGSLETRC